MANNISVRDIMTRDIKVVQVDTSMKEVVATMNKLHVISLMVVQGEKPVGIITERDILKRVVELDLALEYATAGKVMSSPVLTISETANVNEASVVMTKRKIKKLPIVATDDSRLIGIVTTTDIVTKAFGSATMP